MKITKILMLMLLGVWTKVYALETGNCGENCTYILENNVLTIKPTDETKPAIVQAYNRDCPSVCYTDAPWYGKGVTQIDIKEGVTDIKSHAFEDLGSLTSLKLPEGLKTIGTEAFNDSRITNLKLPSSLTSLGSVAFGYSPIKEMNGIPEGVTELRYHVFHGMKLTDLVIPDTVTSIDPYAFGSNVGGYDVSLIKNLYCSESLASQCEAALQWRKDNGADVSVITYQKTPDGKIFYGHKWYENANDILSGHHIKKRIYTVDEATKALGKSKKNTFKIQYR